MRLPLTNAALNAALVLILLPSGPPAQPNTEDLPEFNRIVLDIIAEYPTDGTHGYWWPRGGEGSYDGSSQDVYLLGEKVMSGEEGRRTYCCGLTLEVFARAYSEWLDRSGNAESAPLRPDNWAEFQRLWFVPAVNASGPSAALEAYGLGRTIGKDEALPGDFVQIWRRSGSGHSVVFLDWIREESTGEITGFRYWSSQPGTNGISERVEHFGAPGEERGIADEHTHWGRVEMPRLSPAGS